MKTIKNYLSLFLIALMGIGNLKVNADSWLQKADYPGRGASLSVGFSIGNKGYVGTGNDDTGNRKDFWEYNPSTHVWTQKADFLGSARHDAVGFSVGSKGYIGTGNDGVDMNVSGRTMYEYNPASNTWIQKSNFPGQIRTGAVAFSIGSKGYLGTGYSNTYLNDFWEYDPSNDTWSQKANFIGTAREHAVGFSIGSKGYLGTGDDNNRRKDFYEYNPSSDTWTQKTDFGGTGRIGAAGFGLGTKGYIGLGVDNSMNRNDFWEFDPSANTWVSKATFGGIGRNSGVGFSIGSKGYMGIGAQNIGPNYYRFDFWEYTSDQTFSVPTLSQWGLIILGLLAVTLSLVFIHNRRMTLVPVGASKDFALTSSARQMPFDKKIFTKMMMIILPLSVVGFIVVNYFLGTNGAVDFIGTMVSAVIISYIVHLVAGKKG